MPAKYVTISIFKPLWLAYKKTRNIHFLKAFITSLFVFGVRNAGVKNIVVPAANVDEVKVLTDINVYGFSHLNEVMDFIRGDLNTKPDNRRDIF